MDPEASVRILFDRFDNESQSAARNIRNRVFSAYRDMPWTDEQRKILQPLIKEELDVLIARMLDVFNDIGGLTSEIAEEAGSNLMGYKIHGLYFDDTEGTAFEDQGIGDNYSDYSRQWRVYLLNKQQARDSDG